MNQLPVATELFDVLRQYAKDMEDGKVKQTPSLGITSPALEFCENFYLQFFQNALSKEIRQFSLTAKKEAVRLRLQLKDAGESSKVILLVTWYEKLCDIYPNVQALNYGVWSTTVFLDFHHNYLVTLLQRTHAWAEEKNYPLTMYQAQATLEALQRGLRALEK